VAQVELAVAGAVADVGRGPAAHFEEVSVSVPQLGCNLGRTIFVFLDIDVNI
jgi:hypothetical protein